MHKIMLKFFDVLKSTVQFIKICCMFCIILHLFMWIEHLLNAKWNWLNFIRPFLDFILGLAASVSDGSLEIFDAVFEYKYAIAVVIYILLYFASNFLIPVIDNLAYGYDATRAKVKKAQENAYNASMQKEQVTIETQINKYKIAVKTRLKKKFSYKELGYNLDEQNKIMNKFLMEKTTVSPDIFDDGFVYSFGNFNNVDKILDIFFKLIQSDSPMDYCICVQVYSKNQPECLSKLQNLMSLNHFNKISMLSDTEYRYRFNENKSYSTSQLGLFQKGSESIEIHEFVKY